MDIYINSTYAQSMRGYRMLRMERQGFSEITDPSMLPPEIYSFFTDDLFLAIWCELGAAPKRHEILISGSWFGIKDLQGVFNNGKPGRIDLAMCCGPEEIRALQNTVNAACAGYSAFCACLFREIGVDDKGDYTVDRDAFDAAVAALFSAQTPPFINNPARVYWEEEDMLHLAVPLGDPDRALATLPFRKKRFRKLRGLLRVSEFQNYISTR